MQILPFINRLDRKGRQLDLGFHSSSKESLDGPPWWPEHWTCSDYYNLFGCGLTSWTNGLVFGLIGFCLSGKGLIGLSSLVGLPFYKEKNNGLTFSNIFVINFRLKDDYKMKCLELADLFQHVLLNCISNSNIVAIHTLGKSASCPSSLVAFEERRVYVL